jgi:hypothetical protein
VAYLIFGLGYEEIGLIILFVTGVLAGLWLGFLLGLKACPPVPLPPGASGGDKPKGFIKLGYEVFDG